MVALIVLCALLAAAPLWGPGLVNTRGGGDSPFLLARTLDMAESLRHGILPVRWMAHAAYDLGYPFFNHYAALPFYLSGGLSALGVDLLIAIQITQTLGFVLAALGINLWLRTLWPGKAARLLAVAAYTFAPFHMVNVYVRGDSLSEFYAFAMYPLILWALDRVASAAVAAPGEAGRLRRVVGAIIVAAWAYGALALTHNVSFLIFSPFALLYGLSSIWRHAWRGEQETRGPRLVKLGPALGALVGAFAGGMLLTAWFWLPALVETRYGQLGPAFTAGYFHFSNHFRGANLVQLTPAFNYSVATSIGEAGPFAMGLVQAGLAFLGAVVLIGRLLRTRLQRAGTYGGQSLPRITLLVSLGIATLMMTPLSRPLWDNIPLLATTQFPWRFLSVQALYAAAVTAVLAQPDVHQTGTHRTAAGSIGTASVAAALVALVAGAALLTLQPERLMIRAEDVTRETLLLYESFTGNIGTTIRYEYLPRDVVPRLYISEAVIDGQGAPIAHGGVPLDAHLLARTPVRQVWRLALPLTAPNPTAAGVEVAFPVNMWPGWRASVDGVPVPAYPTTGSGRLTLVLPWTAGQINTYTVTLELRPTSLQRGAAVISVGAFLAGLLVLVMVTWRHIRMETRVTEGTRIAPAYLARLIGRAACVLAVLLLTAAGPLALALVHPPSEAAARFFDFIHMPFPHQGPVDFGAARLVSAQISGAGEPGVGAQPSSQTGHPSGVVARPGQTLDVSLNWDRLPSDPLTVTLRLVSPAAPRHDIDIALAEARAPVAVQTRLTLQLPDDLTRGLYLLQLRLDGASERVTPHTPAGRGMGDLYIGALRIPEGPGLPPDAPVLASFRDLTLHTLDADQPGPEALRLKLTWSTPGTPRNWHLSLRLLDLDGHQIVARDHQPGYGYLPTTLWRPGEQVTDYALLPLPEGLAPGEYTLRIVTYLEATMEGGGETDLRVRLDTPTLYDLHGACCELVRKGMTILCKTDHIGLLSLGVPESISEGASLPIHAEWNALSASDTEGDAPGDMETTWQFVAEGGDVVGETTRPPAPGTRTSLWARHTWVASTFNLDLPPRLEAGDYALKLTLREPGSPPVDCGDVATVTVQPRARSFDVPELQSSQRAQFGTSLVLLGYEVEPDRRAGRAREGSMPDQMTITLWWQAREAPQRDYKRFLHLYDPATEQVVTQSDAMPRDWSYPTTWWVSQEVVSETVRLDLTGIPPGHYRLGVGWYDPETLERLPATAGTASAALDDRVTLELPITLP